MSITPSSYTYQPSTINYVIDGLLELIRGLPSCQAPVAVCDGVPTDLPDTMVVVGSLTEPTVDGGELWATLGSGASRRHEVYEVAVTISAYVGGGDAVATTAQAGDAQKAARDVAFKILADITTALRNDASLTLGSDTAILVSGWCNLARVSYVQTLWDAEESGKGRRADITFTVGVVNELSPI